MAIPAQYPLIETSIESLNEEEGFLHYVAREGRTILRWTIIGCLATTVMVMVTPFWMAAVLPALLMLAAYVLLVLANEVERRSDPHAHDVLERSETALEGDIVDDHAQADQLPPGQAAIVKRESLTGAAIIGGVLLMALIIASFSIPWQLLAIGAFVVFAYMLLVAAPLWLGWIEDDIEIESHRQEGESVPVVASTMTP